MKIIICCIILLYSDNLLKNIKWPVTIEGAYWKYSRGLEGWKVRMNLILVNSSEKYISSAEKAGGKVVHLSVPGKWDLEGPTPQRK